MVIGILKVESVTKVKNNSFYGNYEIKDTYTHSIVNEKYVSLVPPENGIHIVVNSKLDGIKLDITIGKYAFTGERLKDYNKNTEYSRVFGFRGRVYEVTVNIRGELISLDEWFSSGDFEDGNEPDEHYTKKSRGIKWELIEM